MTNRRLRAFALAGLIVAVTAATATAAPSGTSTGPNTTTDPYVLPVGDGVTVKSLLTVGDGAASNGYPMVGIPDGLGIVRAKGEQASQFTLFMNQELRNNQGVVRSHGSKGAFVTELSIDSDTFGVVEGRDLIDPGVRYWNYVTQAYGPTPSPGGANPRDATDTFAAQLAEFSRFCSSTISEWGQFYDNAGKKGYEGQIYFANEENGVEGRVFGITTNGQAQQLPRLGLASWENTVPAHNDGETTVLVADEDEASGQLWVHVGTKQKTGNPFERAGLTNGGEFVVDLANEAVSNDAQFRSTYGKGAAVPFTLGAAEEVDWDSSGARQNTEAAAKGLSLNRVEDGVFDPRHPNDFYFVTTEGGGTVPAEPGVSRDGGGLWLLHWKDVDHPEKGGTLELLLDGSEAPYLNKPDNVTMDGRGDLLIQEDPGGNPHVARIVAYDADSGDRGVVARFNPDQFRSGGPGFITEDEETSGIIDASSVLGKGWFLFDAQVHKASGNPATVELGQLIAMHVAKFKDVYTIGG
jgi:Bacterial protein of unknown function (DUF839)